MVKMTPSFRHWLWENYREKFPLVLFGHVELITDEMWNEYIAWCETEEGRNYLEGGENYEED